ncbi:hypothetical protein GIW41_20880, partial [Pseudomonas sp. PA-6-1D]|uniref:hypothetical protein n=1 Tax=Pseudomonas TaxID=286 RepID=UPI001F873569
MKDQITVDLFDLPAQKRTEIANYIAYCKPSRSAADHCASQVTVSFSHDAQKNLAAETGYFRARLPSAISAPYAT